VAGAAIVAARSSSGIGECACRCRCERAGDNGSCNLPLHAADLLLEYHPKLLLLSTADNRFSCSLQIRNDRRACRTGDDRRWQRTVEIVRGASTTRLLKRRRNADVRSAAAPVVCDFCGSACSPFERQRVAWNSGVATELVLADLCNRCAADGDRLLDIYGGRGRNELRITRERRVAPAPTARGRTLGRVLVYLLVALSSFFLVTLISSLR
jgi:hypothetical protein